MENEKLKKLGLKAASELTLHKMVELSASGDYAGKEALEGKCSQTFEIQHCYWCGTPNCVNPAWPVWFCVNGNHPN
jgi:hypothetical protein